MVPGYLGIRVHSKCATVAEFHVTVAAVPGRHISWLWFNLKAYHRIKLLKKLWVNGVDVFLKSGHLSAFA